jgi:hypothetical protein
MMNALQRDVSDAYTACRKAKASLLRRFPVGSFVRFRIMHSQKNLSTGTVEGVDSAIGTLKILHHQAKEGSRYKYRSVYYTAIVGWSDE